MLTNRTAVIRLTETQSIPLRVYLKRLGKQKLGYSAAKLMLLDRRGAFLQKLTREQAVCAREKLDSLTYQDDYIETLAFYADNRSKWSN